MESLGKATGAEGQGAPPAPPPGECTQCHGPVAPVWVEGAKHFRWPGRWLVAELCDGCATANLDRAEQAERVARLRTGRKASRLPAAARGWNWDTAQARARALKAGEDLEAWQRAYDACRYWHGRGVLYLVGPEGSGKTVLGFCLVAAALEDGVQPPPLWLSLPEYFDLVAAGYGADSEARVVEARAMGAGLLVLDEVGGPGADRPHKRERDSLFKIVNHRVNHQLPTVLTTNHGPDALSRMFRDQFERTIARLVTGGPVWVKGQSFRLLQAERAW